MPSILDHPIVSERYFFSRREALPDPFIVRSGDVRLACYSHAPHRDARTVVYFHGNGEVVADAGSIPDASTSIRALIGCYGVVLTNRCSESGADGFVLAMRVLPPVTVGDLAGGALSPQSL